MPILRIYTDGACSGNQSNENVGGWGAVLEYGEHQKELLALVRMHNVRFFRVKGHVNLNSKSTNFDALYEKFLQWNGTDFSFDDFRYVTAMNNRADELANMGIDANRA